MIYHDYSKVAQTILVHFLFFLKSHFFFYTENFYPFSDDNFSFWMSFFFSIENEFGTFLDRLEVVK